MKHVSDFFKDRLIADIGRAPDSPDDDFEAKNIDTLLTFQGGHTAFPFIAIGEIVLVTEDGTTFGDTPQNLNEIDTDRVRKHFALWKVKIKVCSKPEADASRIDELSQWASRSLNLAAPPVSWINKHGWVGEGNPPRVFSRDRSFFRVLECRQTAGSDDKPTVVGGRRYICRILTFSLLVEGD